MLDFRILSGAVVVAVVIMASIMLSFEPGDVAIATLPRPSVETAIVARTEPSQPVPQPTNAIVIPKPIRTPAVATAAAPASPANDITGSINPASPDVGLTPPPKPRPRVAARKAPEVEPINFLKLLFPFADFSKSPFPLFVKERE